MLRLVKAVLSFVALPALVVAAGVTLIIVLNIFKPKDEKTEPVIARPVVTIEPARKDIVQLRVSSQGEVTPLTEIELTVQVSGKVVKVSPAFKDGGVFKKGALLLEIERRDYELALIRANANLARAEQALMIEKVEADIARQEWEEFNIGNDETPSSLTLREPQLALAKANYEAAQAEVQIADLNLQRTRIFAPFNGRVRNRRADFGQFVTTGSSIGRVFSTDQVEIRLPVTGAELAQLDQQALIRASAGQEGGPEVVLSATIAGERFEWPGHIVRTDASIDPATQQMFLIAEINDPYGEGAARGMPLAVGLFVTAEITGKNLGEAVTVPRSALIGSSTIATLDDANIVRETSVTFRALTPENVVIHTGISPGDRVVISRLSGIRFGDEATPRLANNPVGITAEIEPEVATTTASSPNSVVN